MPNLKINFSALEDEEYSFQQIMKMLHEIQQELLFLSISPNFKNAQTEAIRRKIAESADHVNTYRINIQNLKYGLTDVLEQYEATENGLAQAAAKFGCLF